jgi:hypothetical protein
MRQNVAHGGKMEGCKIEGSRSEAAKSRATKNDTPKQLPTFELKNIFVLIRVQKS